MCKSTIKCVNLEKKKKKSAKWQETHIFPSLKLQLSLLEQLTIGEFSWQASKLFPTPFCRRPLVVSDMKTKIVQRSEWQYKKYIKWIAKVEQLKKKSKINYGASRID